MPFLRLPRLGVGSLIAAPPQATSALFPLGISANKRYLVSPSGVPSFANWESSWLLISEPSLSDAIAYLDNCVLRGVNGVQVQLFSKVQTNNPNNGLGQAPFTTPNDFATLNPAYLSHAADVIAAANARGIVVILAACYAGNGSTNTPANDDDGWFVEMVSNGATKVQALGAAVGAWAVALPNIIWLIGGDENTPATLYNSLITGLKSTDSLHLFTGHWANGSISTDIIATLDINGGYQWGLQVRDQIVRAYAVAGPKPCFMIEGLYDGNLSASPQGNAFAVRQQQWTVMCAGAMGAVNGNESIWWFNSSNPKCPGVGLTRTDYKTHYADPSMVASSYWAAFFKARNWWKLAPDTGNTFITSGSGSGTTASGATLASDGSFGIAYVQAAGSVTADMTKLSGTITARWFDPTANSYTSIGSFANTGTHAFTKPGSNSFGDADWILVLETP